MFAGGSVIFEKETGLDVLMGATVNFNMGVNGVIERFGSGTRQFDITAESEGNAVLVKSAEKLFLFSREFACL